jgi:hypothetical protein
MRFLMSCLMTFALSLPAMADGFGFRTPSGNIYCNGGLDGAHVDCVIVNREGGSAPPGYSCPAGREFEVGLEERGPARAGCGRVSGRKSSYTAIAEYGVTDRFGQITCRSERTGFSCQNVDGHGFFLSRRSQKVY